jgi:hypothetical protein
MNHEFDDGEVCIHCGFDGGWWYVRLPRDPKTGHIVPTVMPLCTETDRVQRIHNRLLRPSYRGLT